MPALRNLAYCYLVSAAAFGLAADLSVHPEIAGAAHLLGYRLHRTLTPFAGGTWKPIADFAWRADVALLDAPGALFRPVQSDAHVRIALAPSDAGPGPDALPRTQVRIAIAPPPADEPVIIKPDLAPDLAANAAPEDVAPPQIAPPQVAPPQIAPPQIALAAPEKSAPPLPIIPVSDLTPEEARARDRLALSLTPEMRAHFSLFLFVSKAEKGPLAQRMYVFRKDDGDLKLSYDWAASTGREQNEVDPGGRHTFTATPAGLYQLDPSRMYVRYRSMAWDQPMPHAMFFNWQRQGLQTGLAIHAASGGDIARLGQRASAGCVHLSPEHARILYDLIHDEYRGRVPRFAIDADETMSNRGRFARNTDGSLRLAEGYRVLIDIENYSGEEADKVAALF